MLQEMTEAELKEEVKARLKAEQRVQEAESALQVICHKCVRSAYFS